MYKNPHDWKRAARLRHTMRTRVLPCGCIRIRVFHQPQEILTPCERHKPQPKELGAP